MNGPLVSVIMPAYNAERFIEKAIKSILDQTYRNFELIIVDDCSADRTMSVAGKFADPRIKIYHNDHNRGIAYSRNLAIEMSNGKYIAIMDDDDISTVSRFQEQVQFLEQNEEIGIVGGRVQSIDQDDNVIDEQKTVLTNPLYIKVNFLFKCIFHNSEIMFRKQIVDEFNIHYRDNCYGMEDFCFWIECSKKVKMTNLNGLMLKHRYHDATETARVKREEYSQRIKLYNELQRYSFTLSGFELSDEEFDVINTCFREGQVQGVSRHELDKLLGVMGKTIHQAKHNEMDFISELDIFYRKSLGGFVRKCADLWESRLKLWT